MVVVVLEVDEAAAARFLVPDAPCTILSIPIIKRLTANRNVRWKIPNVKTICKFELGENGEIYTIVSQQTSENNDIASSIYKSTNNGNSWTLEGTNRESILKRKG